MASYEFLLILCIIPHSLGENSPLWKKEQRSQDLFAQDDATDSLRRLGPQMKGFGEKWIVMPDGDGRATFSLMGDRNAVDRGLFTFADMDDKVKFYLYTPKDRVGVEFNLKKLENIKLNSSQPTKIISHGWMSSATSSGTQGLKEAILDNIENNVIAVDWSHFSKDFFYLFAVEAVPHVGKHVGHLIDELAEKKNVSYKDVHIIGHSLGAHVAGFAGSATKERISRITGLDPALPGFQSSDNSGKLDKSDADFVDVIHTCSGLLGVSTPLGHADFYPNGGSPQQPGCVGTSIIPATTEACSHSRSHEFFAESVYKNSEFDAVKCDNWNSFKEHKCLDVYTHMGEYVSKNAEGIYYLKTNYETPFALGQGGTIF